MHLSVPAAYIHFEHLKCQYALCLAAVIMVDDCDTKRFGLYVLVFIAVRVRLTTRSLILTLWPWNLTLSYFGKFVRVTKFDM